MIRWTKVGGGDKVAWSEKGHDKVSFRIGGGGGMIRRAKVIEGGDKVG